MSKVSYMQPFLNAIDSGVNEHFDKLNRALDGLTDDELRWQPTLGSNPIDWMVWHMARVEDNLINVVLQHQDPTWERDGWGERTGIPYTGAGAGMTMDEIRAMGRINVPKVMEYYRSVRSQTSHYFQNVMQEDDLSRVIGHSNFRGWTGARILGRLLCEEAEHLGQIEYLRGMMRGINK